MTNIFYQFAIIIFVGMISGCSILSSPKPVQAPFDLGISTSAPSQQTKRLATLVLSDVRGNSLLTDSEAILYRLAYSNDQQLHPYTQAKWSLSPAQLLQKRLRDELNLHYNVLDQLLVHSSDKERTLLLDVDLEEFSQIFTNTAQSVGFIRLRATVFEYSNKGKQLLDQRIFVAQQAAQSADALGAVHALKLTSDQISKELLQWIENISTHQTESTFIKSPSM